MIVLLLLLLKLLKIISCSGNYFEVILILLIINQILLFLLKCEKAVIGEASQHHAITYTINARIIWITSSNKGKFLSLIHI